MDFHAVDGNLRHMFRALAAGREEGELRELPGVEIAAVGTPFQMFNAAFLTSPVASEEDLDRRIAIAAVHMQSRGLPWSFWLCEDWLTRAVRRRATRVFDRRRMSLASEMPGMAAEFLRPPVRPLPVLKMVPVADDETRLAFCEIGSICFHVPLTWIDEIFDDTLPMREGCAGWVGYCDGEAVSTVATTTGEGVIGVYNVATLPEFRQRGFGEAVTRYAIARAKESSGIDRTVLQATRHGLALYERMGYASVTRVMVFTDR